MFTPITCEFKHEVRLTITNDSDELTVSEVVEFLNEAIQHFRKRGGRKSTEAYAEDGYRSEIGPEDMLELTHIGKEPLSVGLWTDALIDAVSVADSVEQMANELPMFREHDETTGGSMREILALFDQPGGDLLALVEVNKRFLARQP